jgi:glycolate oxidase FAD binding subunit
MIFARLRALLGPVGVDRDPQNLPRATPDSTEALALVCRLANAEGWRIRIEGHATWQQPDTPADLVLSTRGLDTIVAVHPDDLVATVQAGASVDEISRRLAEQRMLLALDPPGRGERSIGSVVASGTAGPLRHAFGPVRDHVLGCTVVTSDGRVVKAGGRVVKNVAGYDLTKLNVGGFGGFGVITELHLRLRALPQQDVTLLCRGGRDALTAIARDIQAQLQPVALELFSPALAAEPEWVLAVRFAGLAEAVRADLQQLASITDATWVPLSAERTSAFWTLTSRGAVSGPVTFRLGVLGDGLDETLDLLAIELDVGLVSAGAASGSLRWTGEATLPKLRTIRRICANREIPLTLERAPWELRRALGHFGAYREGVGRLVGQMRKTFDPRGLLAVALEGAEGAERE